MTDRARITHSDFQRATRAAASAMSGKPARIIFRLEQAEIEIILGEGTTATPLPSADRGGWEDA